MVPHPPTGIPTMTVSTKTRATRTLRPVAPPTLIALPAQIAQAPVQTKVSQLVSLLAREGGASLTELANSLGWLPHTTRAALTGLRKKGHAIIKSKANDVTRYSIASTGGEA